MSDEHSIPDWVAIAPLHNFFVTDEVMSPTIERGEEPLIKFSDTDAIFYLTDEDEQRLTHLELIRRLGRARWSDRPFAIVVRYQVPTGEEQDRQQAATIQIERILESMRVFASGDLYLGGIAFTPRIPTGTTNRTFRSWPQTFAPWAVSDSEFITKLVAFHRRRTGVSHPTLDLAVHWYSRAVEETRIDDKLISLMTAAEAIVRPTGQFKGRQIADFIAPSFPSAERARVHTLLADAYRLRNSYVHEGVANTTWNSDRSDPDRNEYAVTFEAQNILRSYLARSI